MCDYSLEAYQSRLAREGEALAVHRFPTSTVGLISAEDFDRIHRPREARRLAGIRDFLRGAPRRIVSLCAVCTPPGARLKVSGFTPELQASMGIGGTEEVIFTQKSFEANRHRDAVQFGNGQVLSLQLLQEGQGVQVLSLGGEDGVEDVQEAESAVYARS